jgi:phospholipase C
VPPANGSVPTQEPGVRPSRRLGYQLHVDFEAGNRTLNLALANRGQLGAHVQARSLTVAGGPFSYTIGAGDAITTALPNPGTYDLSLHGANGFFRHFAGSPQTTLRVEVRGDHDSGRLRVRIVNEHAGSGRHTAPTVVNVADAHGHDRHVRVGHGSEELVVDTHHSGGWYDLALTTPSDASFSYQLAGRLESAGKLTSDPQLGRA